MAAVVRSSALAVIKPGRPHVALCLGPVHISRRAQSTKQPKIQQAGNLAAYQQGRGGRSSFSGIVATVFGATGFIGRYVVNRLGKIGSQIIIPYRCETSRTRHLKLAGDLGQVLFLPFHLQDEDELRKAMNYSNVVINLIGRDHETRNFSYHQVHVEGAQTIARLAKEVGVQKLIHVSHVNARPEPPSILLEGGSKFLQSKYFGEEAVKQEFPEAVIIRPADIYGMEDRFLRYYMHDTTKIHLWKRGTETVKMPVHVFDVAQGIVNAVLDAESAGKTFEFVGPRTYYLSELVDYMYRCAKYDDVEKADISLLFKKKVELISRVRPNPRLTVDRLSREGVSDKLESHPTLVDLGITPAKMEDRVPWELKPYRKLGYYEEEMEEVFIPQPPPAIA